MFNRKTKQQAQALTPRQIVIRHNWQLYGICVATGLRNKMRFRWNTTEPEFEEGAIELCVYGGKDNKYRNRKQWWTYGEDFTIGLTLEGEWYVYAWHCENDRDCGPVTYETHLGDFPDFQAAFFAVIAAISSETVDYIMEARAERAMDRKFSRGMDSLADKLTKHFDNIGNK